MKIAINLTPDGSHDLWKNLLADLFTHYTPAVDKFFPVGREYAGTGPAAAVLLQMIDPLYRPLDDLSKALLVFVFDESDAEAGVIETNVEQFTLDNRVQDTLLEIRQGILSSRVLIDEKPIPGYNLEQREAFYKHVENRVMELIKELYDKAFGEVDEITFRFSKEKKDEGHH